MVPTGRVGTDGLRILMGGLGSGRPAGRTLVEDTLSIDVRQLKREGLLDVGASGERDVQWAWHDEYGEIIGEVGATVRAHDFILEYTFTHAWQDEPTRIIQPVALERVPCHLGGARVWFICPGCHSRVAILHLVGRPACRRCHGLTYRTCNMTATDRATDQAFKVQQRLGNAGCGAFDEPGPKPKGMHWRTYERLCDRQAEYVDRSWAALRR